MSTNDGFTRSSDGRRVALPAVCRFLIFLLVAVLIPSTTLAEVKLYGIVSTPPYEGYLIEIDLERGEVVRLFPTGISEPIGLIYDPIEGVLLTRRTVTRGENPEWGVVFSIDPATGASSNALNAEALEKLEDKRAAAQGSGLPEDTAWDVHPTGLDRYAIIDGILVSVDADANKTPIAPLARSAGPMVRRGEPSDPVWVTLGANEDEVLRVRPLSTDIGTIGGLAFAEGFAPELKLEGSFEGGDYKGRRVGALWIDNDGNKRIDPYRRKEDNYLYARIENTGERDAANVAVTFYRWKCDGKSEAEPGSFRQWQAEQVGRDIVGVPAGGVAIASVVWQKDEPWTRCIAAFADHRRARARQPGLHVYSADAETGWAFALTSPEVDRKRVLNLKEGRDLSFSYPGASRHLFIGEYPVALARRPLIMHRGMTRASIIPAVKKAGTRFLAPEELIFEAANAKPMYAVDFGFAWAVHRNIELGLSNYRVGAMPPTSGQGLSVTHEDGKVRFGDIPAYARFRFLERATWEVAADIAVVFPTNTKLAASVGLPIRNRPLGYNLAIDWGVEVTVLTESMGTNVELPVKLTYNPTYRGFFFFSTGLSLQQLGRGSITGSDSDSSVAFPKVRANNQVFIPLALGGGGTVRCAEKNWMMDIYGQGGFHPLAYLNAPSGGGSTQDFSISKSWFLILTLNTYWHLAAR